MPVTRLRRLCCALVSAGVLATPVVAGASGASAAGAIDGPDVSSYQHPYGAAIRWSAVAAAGKEFAIVKATEGTSYTNPWFGTDYSHIRRAGMVRGSYHFARPAYPIASTAVAQAKYYVHRLGSSARTSRTLPPALDLEMTGGLDRGALVTWAQTFLYTVRRLTGRTPMIYTYPYFWTSSLGDAPALARYPLWMASYSSGVDDSAMLWQYTSTARVKGIRGSVDMSRLTAPATSWKSLSDGRPRTAWPAQAPGAPQAVWASASAYRATVHWLPGDTGSRLVQSYRVTASPGGATVVVDGVHTSATLRHLHNGTPYTFTVRATNAVGTGARSLASSAVTPMVSTRLVTSTPRSIVYGHSIPVRVSLSRADTGTPLAGRTLLLQIRPVGTTAWSAPTELVTDDTGRAHKWLRTSGSIDVRVRYDAPTGWVSRRTRSTVLMSTGITAALSATEVPVGTEVALTGVIAPATPGITVTRQVWRAGTWQVADRTVTDEGGAFAFAFTPVQPGAKTSRLVVPAFGGRTRSVSSTLSVQVR
ncbi:MAG TPA: GH25 family lysozyme [Mycobacteriales bacterium]|nr:GH25 family lysozyme [Mycobacteriales bacterium]